MLSDRTPHAAGTGTTTSVAPASAPAPGPEPTYVPPGRLVAVGDGRPLTTIVSSGIALCLWDPVTGIGGMCHFLLPAAGTAPPATRFGDVAVAALVAELAKLGAPDRRLRGRFYGGSAPPLATQGLHLGDSNIESATAQLTARHVPLMDRETGGSSARKVIFSPQTGTAEVTRIGLN